MSIFNLPCDIHDQIFGYLNQASLHMLYQTCKFFHSCLRNRVDTTASELGLFTHICKADRVVFEIIPGLGRKPAALTLEPCWPNTCKSVARSTKIRVFLSDARYYRVFQALTYILTFVAAVSSLGIGVAGPPSCRHKPCSPGTAGKARHEPIFWLSFGCCAISVFFLLFLFSLGRWWPRSRLFLWVVSATKVLFCCCPAIVEERRSDFRYVGTRWVFAVPSVLLQKRKSPSDDVLGEESLGRPRRISRPSSSLRLPCRRRKTENIHWLLELASLLLVEVQEIHSHICSRIMVQLPADGTVSTIWSLPPSLAPWETSKHLALRIFFRNK